MGFAFKKKLHGSRIRYRSLPFHLQPLVAEPAPLKRLVRGGYNGASSASPDVAFNRTSLIGGVSAYAGCPRWQFAHAFIHPRKESFMVAKCANASCNREFRELNKGRLFLLPPRGMRGQEKLSDYCYWLCPERASLYALELEGTSPVIRARPREDRPVQRPKKAPAKLRGLPAY